MGVEEELGWKRGAQASPRWGSRTDGEEDVIAGLQPGGGFGNHCW